MKFKMGDLVKTKDGWLGRIIGNSWNTPNYWQIHFTHNNIGKVGWLNEDNIRKYNDVDQANDN